MNDEVKELVKKWCDRKLTQEDIPKILYYYAKDVKHQEVSGELIMSTLQLANQTQVLNIDLALHDIVCANNLYVTEVQSAPDLLGRRIILYRKFYEDK